MNLEAKQALVDPVGTVTFVAGHLQGPRDRFTVVMEQTGVGGFQQRLNSSGLVILTGRQMKLKRMTVGVAEQMDFGTKTSARTA